MGTFAIAATDKTYRGTTVAATVDTITVAAGAGRVEIFSYGDFVIDAKDDSTVDPTVGDVSAYFLPAGIASVTTIPCSTSRALVLKLVSSGIARYVVTAFK